MRRYRSIAALVIALGAPALAHAQTIGFAVGGLAGGSFFPGAAQTLWVSNAALNVCASVIVPIVANNQTNPAITIKLLPSGTSATIPAGPSFGSGTLTGPQQYRSVAVCATNSTSLTITGTTSGGTYSINPIPHVP